MTNISNKLNQHFIKYFINFDNTYETEDAKKYLSHNRIDVIAKIIYCEYFLNITPTNFNKLFYYLHLKKWNNFKATDCTLPADLDPGNFVHKIGEILKPTK